ncbi:Uncharacterised protein [Escherichia coli]|nr:Uncharacterised protein [Escherichia coli]
MRAGNGYLAVTYRRPDKLAFLQAFGEQAQTISISPKNFDGVTPSATEDKQVTGEGIIISAHVEPPRESWRLNFLRKR